MRLTLLMHHNPHRATLSFDLNEENQGLITDIYGDKDLNYRLCVHRTIQLISVALFE